ncbi:hypothetical protein C8R48DRAFT_774240 [Suillus tomentosus]|nr:hypothetical protein C8R48DRAFT_774240 [Suillus tomentosus]
MLSSPLKFDLSTLQSLSASASSTHTSPHSHDRHHNDNHDSGIRNLYEVLEAVNAMSDQEPTESEARIMMNLVRAKRDVHRAQKVLAECVMQENEVFASLLKFQAEAAEKRLDDTDLGLGCMRVICNTHGWSVPPSRLTHAQGTTLDISRDRTPMIQLD